MNTTKIESMVDEGRCKTKQLPRSSKMRCIALAIVGVALIGCTTVPAPKTSDAEAQIVAIIESIEKGWEQANGAPFREHFLDFEGARYIESGGQNQGLSDLVDHHVVPEGDALKDFDLSFSNIETQVEGAFAWAIADVEVIATLTRDGRRIHNRGYETFLFRSVGNQWKVVHTHSSSRPVKNDDHEH